MSEYGKVAVLMGGRAAEREVSLRSGAAVLEALRRRGVDAHGVDAAADVLDELARGGYARVFIALHGRGGEDGVMQGALEALGLPYTGSGVLASALGMDKLRTKQLWQGVGLPTPEFRLLSGGGDAETAVRELGLPLMIKPAREGSSIGITRVMEAGQAVPAYEQAAVLDGLVMAEHYIRGEEYTVAVLDGRALPVIGLQTPRGFYDFAAKYEADDTRYLLPSGLSEEREAALQDLALRAFAAVGARGWGRVDLMLDTYGQPWLLEVNTVPGLTDHSLVPMAAAAAGIDFDALILRILDSSLMPAEVPQS
jgi:D-alanine-D-alanine ligase